MLSLDELSLLVIPYPDERLGCDGLPGPQLDDRLVLDPHAVLVDGPTQHAFGAQSSDRPGAEGLVEDLAPIPSAVLGPVEREVCLLEEHLGAMVGVRCHRDADAGGAD